MIVTSFFAVTFLWATAKVAEVLPPGMVTEAGTVAAKVFELESLTTMPPVGAGPDSVTVPTTEVDELPTTLDGLTDTDTKVGSG